MKGSGKILKYNKKRIYIAAIIIIVAAAVYSTYYYFNIYLQPNFSDESLNFVSAGSGGLIKPGNEITYTINFENNGVRTVSELEIIAKIPENTELISAGSDENVDAKEGRVRFVISDDIKKGSKGSVEFIVKVHKPLGNGTPIILDQVVFDYKIKDEKHSKIINADFNHKVKSSPEFGSFDLEIVDKNRGSLRMGDEINCILKVENTGNMDASGVEVKSVIPGNVTILEESISSDGKIKDGSVIWNIESLGVDEPKVLSFSAKVNDDLTDGEIIVNTASINCEQDASAEKKVESKVCLFSDLSGSEAFMYDANGGYLWAGETISVKIVIRNAGEKAEENYKLICPIPVEATYISKSGTPEGIRWSDEIRGLVWDLKDLGVGEEKSIVFNMQVNQDLLYKGGTVTTNFKIESSSGEIEIPSKSITIRRRVNMNIVAMGDSLIVKSNWAQTFDELLEANYPYADYNTIVSAKSGELARDGYERFDSTVAVHNPQIIIIAYGTNDAGKPGLSEFRANLEGIVVKSKNLGARVFVNLIGPINYPGKENYSETNDIIKQVASKYGVVVIDVLTPLSQNPGGYFVDGIHYSSAGASVVAHTVFSYVSQYLGDIGQRL